VAKDRHSSGAGSPVRRIQRPVEVARSTIALTVPAGFVGLNAVDAPIALNALVLVAVVGVLLGLDWKLRAEAKELLETAKEARRLQTIVHEGQQIAVAQQNEVAFKLQQLDRAKNDFVSSVSHELRSPLTSTLGYLELLSDGDAGELQPEQARMVEIASRNAKRLQTLIEDLLTLSRIETGTFRLRFQPVDIGATTRAVVALSATVAKERNVQIHVAIDDQIGTCPGEETQLIKAIDNIVNNAVKFTPTGGAVNVEVLAGGDGVTIRVQDNGIGIAADEQAMLFDRFFRATIAVEQAHHGTGLGLTIAKTIIEHHGGTITLESTDGVGTTVSILLPSIPMTVPAPSLKAQRRQKPALSESHPHS